MTLPGFVYDLECKVLDFFLFLMRRGGAKTEEEKAMDDIVFTEKRKQQAQAWLEEYNTTNKR